MNVEDRLM